MNLVDILIPEIQKRAYPPAVSAESAENQQRGGLRRPQVPAEICGLPAKKVEIRNNSQPNPQNPQNPQAPADPEILSTPSFPQNPQNPQGVYTDIEKPVPESREYFRAQGAEVLADDLTFLQRHLPQGTVKRNACIGRYINTWQQSAASEPAPYRNQNAGRRAANTWLRTDGSSKQRICALTLQACKQQGINNEK